MLTANINFCTAVSLIPSRFNCVDNNTVHVGLIDDPTALKLAKYENNEVINNDISSMIIPAGSWGIRITACESESLPLSYNASVLPCALLFTTPFPVISSPSPKLLSLPTPPNSPSVFKLHTHASLLCLSNFKIFQRLE